jgi:hypothetical protein
MLSIRSKRGINSTDKSCITSGYLKDYIAITSGNNDIFSQAAKDYAVKSCMDNIASLKFGLDNKLISGKPYKMAELHEQAIYAERAFTAGVQWAFRYVGTIKKAKI